MAIDYAAPLGQLRLLINDDRESDQVFPDVMLAAFLALEGDSVKRAAAQALDVIADDEALTSKVIRTQDLTTDGTKVAASLRERAKTLRAQADAADDDADEGYFEVIDIHGDCVPERTQYPHWP